MNGLLTALAEKSFAGANEIWLWQTVLTKRQQFWFRLATFLVGLTAFIGGFYLLGGGILGYYQPFLLGMVLGIFGVLFSFLGYTQMLLAAYLVWKNEKAG